MKPSGSYTESNILNPNVSVLMFHTTSNTLSFCFSSFERSLMLMFFLQFSSGIDSIASILLLTNFVKLNPPAFQTFLIHWIKSTASSSPLEDFSMSSTSVASVPNSFSLSTEVHFKIYLFQLEDEIPSNRCTRIL